VVAGEHHGGEPVEADLLRTGSLQHGLRPQARAVEDVVEDVLLLPGVSDLPSGPLERVQAVGGGEGEGGAGGDGGVDGFTGRGIEVAGEDDRPVLGDGGEPGDDVCFGCPLTSMAPLAPALLIRRDIA